MNRQSNWPRYKRRWSAVVLPRIVDKIPTKDYVLFIFRTDRFCEWDQKYGNEFYRDMCNPKI